MKQLLFSLIFLFNLICVAQHEVEHIHIGSDSTAENSLFPHISTFYEGIIPLKEIASEEGIQLKEGYSIISFEVNYSINGKIFTQIVNGNVFPTQLIQEIKKNALGDYIFITKIVAKDATNTLIGITPMSLIPIE